MKVKKLIILSIICSCTFTTNVLADSRSNCTNYSDNEYNYIVNNTDPADLDLTCSNGTLFTDLYLDNVNDIMDSLDNTTIQTRYFVTKLSVPNYLQENPYYCGPANVKQVVQYLNGSSVSQSTYANYMGTTQTFGTYVYAIKNALNHYTSLTYNYVQGSNYSLTSFTNLVKSRTDANKPIVLHADTQYLYLYYGSSLNHYLTVNGYTYSGSFSSNGIDNISYVDTWNGSYGRGSVLGEHIDSSTNVYSTISGSNRYIIQ